MTYLNILLDVALIGLLVVGISYAVKLSKQLAGMRAARVEMERFIFDFNTTVVRAEKGVNNLKNAARSAGDDLEKLIEKGQMLRDELQFLTESADLIANRLSSSATQMNAPRANEPAPRAAAPAASSPAPAATAPKPAPARTADVSEMPKKMASPQALAQEMKNSLSASGKVPSSAERELLRALEKLG